MYRLRSAPRPLIALVGVVAIVAAACGGAAPSAPRAPPRSAAAPSAEPSLVAVTPEPIAGAVGPNGGKVVRWFIGIGSGGKPEQIAAEQAFAEAFNADPANKDKVYLSHRDLRQQGGGRPARHPDRGRQPAGHHRTGRRGRPQHLPRQPARREAAHRVAQLRHDQVRPGAGRLLRHRQGRRHDRRPVRDLPVVHLLQQEAVRRGQAAVPAGQGR